MKKSFIKKLLVLLIVVPGIPYILGSISLLTYSFWPQSYADLELLKRKTQAKHVILLAHGLKDTPKTWANDLAALFGSFYQDQHVSVFALDWSPYAQSTFRCSVNGVRIGEQLANELSKNKNLQSLHLIAHSCGSFVIYSLCETLKAYNPAYKIQTTYLDPVSVYGGVRWDYGLDYFGDCADFSEAYIDTEDGIPGSNEPLVNAFTFDVTPVRQASGFEQNPHLWPPAYYIELFKRGKTLQFNSDQNMAVRYPKQGLQAMQSFPE